jgi:hypothetical protein
MLPNLAFNPIKIQPIAGLHSQPQTVNILKDGVRFAETKAEFRASYQLRHKIYVEGMNRFSDKSNHELKELQDEHDKNARAIVAIKKNKTIGTLRIFWGGDTHFTQEHEKTYHISKFTSLLQAKKICIVERLMVENNARGSLTILRMYQEVMNFVLKNRVEVVLLNCEQHHMNSYLKLGFRPFAQQTMYPGIGPVTPMALVVGDYKYLQSIGSSFSQLINEENLNHCHHVESLKNIIDHDTKSDSKSSSDKNMIVSNFCAARQKLLAKRPHISDSKLRMKLSIC